MMRAKFALDERYRFDWKRILLEDNYHIEYSITDKCNRNCRACSHLAPLAQDPNFVSLEEFTRIVTIMQKCVPDTHTFWLTGGEPTLHPMFMGLLETARHIFADSYIGIYTNGTTLKNYKADEAFWRFIRDNGIVWAVTTYDSSPRYFEDMFEYNGCLNNLAIVQSGKKFFNLTTYSTDQIVSEEKFDKCGWEKIKLNIRNGKIYNCAAAEFVDLYNNYFGVNIPLCEKDYLIIDDSLNRNAIDKFKHASPFCGYCDLNARYRKIFVNEPSKRLPYEWAV